MQSRILVIVALTTIAFASNAYAQPPENVAKTFDQVVAAVASGDQGVFATMGTPEVKSGVTAEVMGSLKSTVGKRLTAGYRAEYLCELNQAGLKVYLWKVSFKDGGDDVVVRIAMQEELIAGFFLQ